MVWRQAAAFAADCFSLATVLLNGGRHAQSHSRGSIYELVRTGGVKVNIAPLQEAGVLRYRKVL
jgi:hypothetical protein